MKKFNQRPRPQTQNPKFQDQRPRPQNTKQRFQERGAKSGEFGGPDESGVSAAAHRPSLIFGVLPVLESLKAGARRLEKILIADGARERRLNEILDLAREKEVPFQKIPREHFSRYVDPDVNHQGIIALTSAADYTNAEELLSEIFANESSLSIILDGVEDPRNLGAILRTADCAGVNGVFIPERRAVGLTEVVAKTSAGATEYVKIAKVTNLSRLIDEMKEHGIWTVGTSADAKLDYTDWDWTRKSALVLGSEGKGLHRLVAEKCDVLVKIPLRGHIGSLNVSVAAGVVLFEAVRQRNKNEEKGDQ